MNKTDLLNWHLKNGLIDVTQQTPGIRILVETEDNSYEFEVATPKRSVVLMSQEVGNGPRDKAVLIGSENDANTILYNVIGQGLRMILRIKGKRIAKTKPVIAATVSDKDYSYSLWE